MKPLLVLGCIRSGTTILHELLLLASENAVDLTDDDFESRYYWQHIGLKIGSRSTGTYCCSATQEDVRKEEVSGVQAYIKNRTQGGKALISKGPHLMNKVPFIAKVLPEALFVIIIRDPMSVVASTKLLFDRASVQNEDHPPFVHYWPEGNSPCWWAVRDDRRRFAVTRGLIRRKGKHALSSLGLRRKKVLTAPGKILGHERLSAFVLDHPDLGRYYPGTGFPRIPEAWLALNVNACKALGALGSHRWLPVVYSEFVANPRQTIAKICEFAELPTPAISSVPERLDESRAQKWRRDLTGGEQEVVESCLQNEGRRDFETLSEVCQRDLLPAGWASV